MQQVIYYETGTNSDVYGSGLGKSKVLSRWSPPDHVLTCLNSDGAAKCGDTFAGCGGVIRDNSGKWIGGFSKALGSSNAFIVELWGV
jgi:hypothetical protein